uniref:biliverdin-producing heme oxygenase n=1 Tax=uncultured Sphingomonas sp. TaxID=158754 RepID=UPI0035CC09D7
MAHLRARTAHAHARVDATFGSYDLTNPALYADMLVAHARALPTAESLVVDDRDGPPLRLRTPLLAADLTMLGCSMPEPIPFAASILGGGRWGVRYVIEGSRLGGGVLATRVSIGLPTAYLSDRHEAGEWRSFGAVFDAEAARHPASWLSEAVVGAEACFDLYGRAAGYGSSSLITP